MRFGRQDADVTQDVCLAGLSIKKEHCIFYKDGEGKISVNTMPGAKVYVNGEEVKGERAMKHKDRIIIGTNHVFVFIDPKVRGRRDSLLLRVGGSDEGRGQELTAQEVAALKGEADGRTAAPAVEAEGEVDTSSLGIMDITFQLAVHEMNKAQVRRRERRRGRRRIVT